MQKDSQMESFNRLVVGFTIPIVFSGLALFILGTSKNVAIYFSTDKEGKEIKKRF